MLFRTLAVVLQLRVREGEFAKYYIRWCVSFLALKGMKENTYVLRRILESLCRMRGGYRLHNL